MLDRDDVLALCQGGFVSDLVLEQRIGILATFLGGDDALGGQGRRGGDQTLGIGMLRMLQHLKRRTGFDDLTFVHHDDMLGAFGGETEVVGDEQHGGAQ